MVPEEVSLTDKGWNDGHKTFSCKDPGQSKIMKMEETKSLYIFMTHDRYKKVHPQNIFYDTIWYTIMYVYMVYKKDLYILEKLAETKVAESL